MPRTGRWHKGRRVPRRRKRRKCRPRPVGAGIADGPQSQGRHRGRSGRRAGPVRRLSASVSESERLGSGGRPCTNRRAHRHSHTPGLQAPVYTGATPVRHPARPAGGAGGPRRQARRGGIAGVAGARAVLAVARWCAGTKPPSMECRRRKCGAPAMRARESSAGGPIRARRRGCRRRPFRRGLLGAGGPCAGARGLNGEGRARAVPGLPVSRPEP